MTISTTIHSQQQTGHGQIGNAAAGDFWQVLAHVAKRVGVMLQVARERRQLAKLDRHQLRDLGLDADVTLYEAQRPFWDIPQARRF